ncbi:Calcium-transporting ATPase 12, plasma membrane-type [Sesamum alatum]|uniref:Calcium-transporting ATPase n=1 Tax=Sesamum alatum TaxID=300844 RepID=A0AAE1Y8S1_9LAMI|nr:Calcium-transporting ATPase 12, plasma membrane-type [Sesamum alatum]
MEGRKQTSSLDSEGKSGLMASSSSAFFYRKPEPRSITGFHRTHDESHSIVIELQRSGSGSGFSGAADGSDLSSIVREKDLTLLGTLGGVEGIADALKTHLRDGIGGDFQDISRRKETFGDVIILVLLVCAALSLGLGVKANGLKEGWYDGGSIFLAVFVVIFVRSTADFWQKGKLEKVFEDFPVVVIRSGRRRQVSAFDIVVGDVVCLKMGDQVPADGLFVEGYSLRVDESSMTGENILVHINRDQNPFLLSGTKVAEGYAKMLVVSVGLNTEWGLLLSSISVDSREETLLETRLNKLASSLGFIGLSSTVMVLVILLVRYFTGHTKNEDGTIEFVPGKTKGVDVINNVLGIIAAVVSILVVAIPEELPLAVGYILAYSTDRMKGDHQTMVRNLSAFEAVSSVTTICTDLTGILTSNEMVTKCLIGQEWIEARGHSPIAPNVLELLFQGIRLTKSSSVQQFLAVTTTDDAIHSWAVLKLNMEMNINPRDFALLDLEASCPEKKIGVLVKNQSDETFHAHWKGDAEIILSSCSHYLDATGNIVTLDDQERQRFHQIIEDMAADNHQSIGFAHKQISQDEYENEVANSDIPNTGLVLLGIFGLKLLCSPSGKGAVEICQQAGISVKLITGGNALLAKAISMECGILPPNQGVNDGSMVKGEEFRNYTDKERLVKVDCIRVMPRSCNLDKLLAVKCLKENGHVVASIGNSLNDAPSLHEANVGISVGSQATVVLKESSDIVILDNSFASVAQVLRWARCVYNNIQKHTQFNLTLYASALAINIVAAISVGKMPLTPAQLIWVDLTMNTLAALALAAEEPNTELMKKRPVSRSDPLITNIMWRNIISQTSYQITVVLALKFKGRSIFDVHDKTVDTLVFNTFVLCQVFNLFNARKLEEKNVFKGILKNKLFIGITCMIVILQIILVEFLNKFARTEKLNWEQWAACIIIAAVSWPFGFLIKYIPVPDTDTIFNFLLRMFRRVLMTNRS